MINLMVKSISTTRKCVTGSTKTGQEIVDFVCWFGHVEVDNIQQKVVKFFVKMAMYKNYFFIFISPIKTWHVASQPKRAARHVGPPPKPPAT